MSKELLLRRLDVVSYKNKSGSDAAQIPTTATIDLYRQGASVKTAITVPLIVDPTPVVVDDIGGIAVGDDLIVNGAATPTLTVESVAEGELGLIVSVLSSVSLSVGDRLTPISTPRPNAYRDPIALSAIGTSFTTSSTTGRGSAYVKDYRYDYVMTISGVTPRLYADAVGGYVLSAPYALNVLNFSSIQAAVDALPPKGGMVYIPRGEYNAGTTPAFVAPLTLPYDRSVHLMGDGVDETFLINTFISGGDPDADLIYVAGDEQIVEGMTLRGPGDIGPATGRGIVLRRRGPIDGTNQILFNPILRNLLIRECPSWGLDIDTTQRDSLYQFVVKAAFDNVEVRTCGTLHGGAIHIGGDGTTTTHFKNCQVRYFGGVGILCDGAVIGPSGVSFLDTIIEQHDPANVDWMRFDSCRNLLLQHLWVEAPTSGTPSHALITLEGECVGVGIYDCLLSRLGGSEAIDIKVLNVGELCSSVVLQNAYVESTRAPSAPPVVLQEGASQVTIIGGTVHTFSPADATEPLNVDDQGAKQTTLINTMKRIRVPALTTTERDALENVSIGDVIYNSSRGQFHTGTPLGGWLALLSESYVRLPGYASASRPSVTSGDFGFMIYDITLDCILYVDNSGNWRRIVSAAP